MAYWQPVPGQAVPGAVLPHGYSFSWLPPAAAYSHSASLGRNPPSQMQNAADSHQFTQLIGRFSCVLAVFVQALACKGLVTGQNLPPALWCDQVQRQQRTFQKVPEWPC